MNRTNPTALIGPGVEPGRRNVVGPHVVIHPGVTLGDGNGLGVGVALGAPPEIRSSPHPRDEGNSFCARLVIGSGNTIREAARIRQGSEHPTWWETAAS